tara:strand:- start:471 stop:926 length:456 start_codon:yes stop_codon:yes gene_type:complete
MVKEIYVGNVKVNCDGKTRRLPKRYLANLKGKEKIAQIKSICDGKNRPKTSFKSRKSNWTQKFNAVYGDKLKNLDGGKSLKNISSVTGIDVKAITAVHKKGMGAYFNGGSRPNQTPDSWGRARVYSYIMGGNTRKVDAEITKKYNVKFSHF